MNKRNLASFYALLAAALYAVNIPLSKLLLKHVGSLMMAAFLYLGAGVGLLLIELMKSATGKADKTERLTKKELPYTAAMVLLDISAPILLMLGIARTNSANVSLLNNFEIVATSLIALLLFKESISRRLWAAIGLVSLASVVLSFEGQGAFTLNRGSLLVLGACLCWGFENNCTKRISNKSSTEIVIIKGLFSGSGSFLLALLVQERIPPLKWIALVMLLGFVSYGLSINYYIKAQQVLGAAKTSAFYSVSPFLGAAFGMLFLKEAAGLQFYAALIILIFSTWLLIKDNMALEHAHPHEHTHTHAHRHGTIIHTHPHTHRHTHTHIHEGDPSHQHSHKESELSNHHHVHSFPLQDTVEEN